jgi:hypothetical protein
MIRSRVHALIVAAATLPAFAACDVQVGKEGFSLDVASGRAQDTWTRSYTLAPGGRLELINTNGRINAEPASGEQLELVAERTAKSSTDEAAQDLMKQLEIREETSESRVRIEVRAPRSFGVSGFEVRWTVKVPRGVIVDLRTSNGRVALTGLQGEVRASTVNGGIEGRGLDVTSLEATTVNGGVDVELTSALTSTGSVTLEAVNGGVELALPGGSQASVVARVTNGGINTSGLDFQTTGEQTRRRFEGTLNGGGARVSLQTTNGGVRLSKSTS